MSEELETGAWIAAADQLGAATKGLASAAALFFRTLQSEGIDYPLAETLTRDWLGSFMADDNG